MTQTDSNREALPKASNEYPADPACPYTPPVAHDYASKQRDAFEKWCESVTDYAHTVQPNSPTERQRLLGWQAATAHFASHIAHILHPNGIKHPQQLEPEWVIDEVRARIEDCGLLRLLVETEITENSSVPLDDVKGYLDGRSHEPR
jgi:hypothetical protein